MAYIKSEEGIKFDQLIGGTLQDARTENIATAGGVEIPRGALVTKTGVIVGAGDVAYGVVAIPVEKTDTYLTVYISGEFNIEKMIVAEGDTVEAHKDELRANSIYLTSLHYIKE